MSDIIKKSIAQAILENKTITITYQKYDGTVSSRTISNIIYSIEYGKDYIDAFCHLRQDKRTFKINRIISIANESIRTSKSTYIQSPKSVHNYDLPNYKTKNQPNEGCYIATMAYGDYNHPQVLTLRRFRDDVLLKSKSGRLLVKIYYYISPKLVYLLKDFEIVNVFIRKILNRICYVLVQKEK